MERNDFKTWLTNSKRKGRDGNGIHFASRKIGRIAIGGMPAPVAELFLVRLSKFWSICLRLLKPSLTHRPCSCRTYNGRQNPFRPLC